MWSTNWWAAFPWSYLRKFVEKLGVTPHRCFFFPHFVSYKDAIIESKYVKSSILTMQDDYKDEIVFAVIDMEKCNIMSTIMSGRQWHEARNRHIFYGNGIQFAIVPNIIEALVILLTSPRPTEFLLLQIELQTIVGSSSTGMWSFDATSQICWPFICYEQKDLCA